MSEHNTQWVDVCAIDDLQPFVGVRALVEDQQVAIFRVADELHAVSAVDPFSRAAVLSRGLVGDLNGELVVTSPIYKQHFSLRSGICQEDKTVAIAVYPVREAEGRVQVFPQPDEALLAQAG